MNKPQAFPQQLEIVRIGDAVGVILPAELLQRLRLAVGDKVSVEATDDGSTVAAEESEVEHQMVAARAIMKRYRNALSELAK